jgi:outer membrane protein assembly factor BamA
MKMNAVVVSLACFCSFTSTSNDASDATVKAPPKKPEARVGQIYIIGNERTKMSVILDQVGMYPGQSVSFWQICRAEFKLARLGIFKCTPDGAVRPKIEVVSNPQNPESVYKDVYIHVQEDHTGRASLKHGLNAKGEWVLHFVVEERNLDPWRWPTSREDLLSGNAFRGAGLKVGVDCQFKVPVWPIRAPSVSLKAMLPVFSQGKGE